MRKLIVNADDLGLTAGVNRAILESHSGGVVSSATLMANGPAFADAVSVARSVPNLAVGCHVVLVGGTPVSPPGAVDTLLAIRSAEPDKFYSSLSEFAARAMLGGFDPDQLVAEITAQIKKIQSTGLQVTHLDTHKHAHIFPEILAALLRAARICGVRAIRNPFVPLAAMPARQFKSKPDLWKRYGQVRMLHTFSGPFHQRIKRSGLLTPDGVLGVIETGSVDGFGYTSLLRQTLANLPEGTWEFVCHPGYNDADLRQAGTRLLESREEERRLLTSAELRRFLEEQKIQIVSYRDFAEKFAEKTADQHAEPSRKPARA
ncbi:MAG: ChbG/HpnK family deacetylase [Acidobacteriia bacterium]|nr:ChbG/HpnK family deacetylase [Terriglobia bacterium]